MRSGLWRHLAAVAGSSSRSLQWPRPIVRPIGRHHFTDRRHFASNSGPTAGASFDRTEKSMSDWSESEANPRSNAKAARKVLADADRNAMDSEDDDENFSLSDDEAPKKKAAAPKRQEKQKSGGKSIEEIYQKKTQLEHIILRPDTYVGSVESTTASMWVLDSASGNIVMKSISYVPGLYKIFDEILVNAADNKVRDPSMDRIEVVIDEENKLISVYNNGRGVPIEMHAKEGVYVPELIFGHLLTSSNYDDSEKKVTGGRNGYGAKLCNIFSTKFVVETGDSKMKKIYKQTFSKNMSVKGEPIIKSGKTEDFTKITFFPDLLKFGMTHLDDDIIALFSKRAYDLAGCVPGIKVALNGSNISVKNFKDYVKLYIPEPTVPGAEPPKIVYEKVDARWEVACFPSDGQFQQVSFVNSICTHKGGKHVDHVVDQIAAGMIDMVKKKDKKDLTIKPFQAKAQLAVFINCLIENPAFDSQTKENMTLKISAFGSKCVITEDFNKKVAKTGVVDNILEMARFKSQQAMKKTDGKKSTRISGISKLDDANQAGTKNGHMCTLILTEGDSAKTLAVSGLSVVGRDHFGVFPLRGKLLNVRETSATQVKNNAEITAVKQILGLQQGKEYNSAKDLRYGHIMIMTDQDHDGSHIKGLIINMLDHFWPSLLRIPGFLQEFITPIVKCTPKAKGGRKKEISFYTIPEYESWKKENEDGKGFNIKYYKGLGTSTPEDAKKYFADMEHHRKPFSAVGEKDRDLVDLAFNKKKADERKEWLRQFQPGTYMDHSVSEITVTDFINRELILFSLADNMRSIPSAVDGMKPGQRKILYACFKRKLNHEIKVTQLAGYVSEHSAYHHGEASLFSTMIGMAQNFVGSNNLPLLEPRGQFGTRLQGGKDAASPRYIFTALNPLARVVFHPEDDALLMYLNDDGQDIEPSWYLPIIPMALVNGGEGIGTGWSCSIPNYNPRDVVANLIRRIDNEPLESMQPWYRGFKGAIVPEKANRFKVSGIITKTSDTTVEITELPLKTWTQTYKEFLEAALHGDDSKEKKVVPWIKDFKEYHTDTSVKFVVTLAEENMKAAEAEGLEKRFKLTGSIATSNLVLFDLEGRISKYETVEAVMEDFYNLRLKYYFKRKDIMLARLEFEWTKLDNRVRFILEIINGTLVVQNRKRVDLLLELRRRNYFPVSRSKEAAMNGGAGAVVSRGGDAVDESAVNEDETEDVEAGVPSAQDYEYLLGMPIWSLTMEKVEQLKRELKNKQSEMAVLTEQTPAQLWRIDLDSFLAHWDTFERELEEAESVDPAKIRRLAAAASKGRKAAVVAKKRKGGDYEDEDDDDDFVVGDRGGGGGRKAKVVEKEDKNTAKPRVARTKKPVVDNDPIEVDDDDDDDYVTKQVEKKVPVAASKPVAMVKSEPEAKPKRDLLNEFRFGASAAAVKAEPKVPQASAPPVRKAVEVDYKEDAADDDVDAPRSRAPVRRAAGVRQVIIDGSEDEFELGDKGRDKVKAAPEPWKPESMSEDEEEEPVKPKKTTSKSKDAEESDFEVDVKPTKAKAPAKAAPPQKAKKEPVAKKPAAPRTRKPKVTVVSESEEEADKNDEFGFDETPPKKKAATTARNVVSPTSKITDYFTAPKLSAADKAATAATLAAAAAEAGPKKRTLSRKVVASNGKPITAAGATKKAASRKDSFVVDDDEEEEQEETIRMPAKRKIPAKEKAAAPKKTTSRRAIVDEDDDDVVEVEAKAPAPKRNASKRAIVDDDDDDEVDMEAPAPVAAGRRTGRAAALKAVQNFGRRRGDDDDDENLNDDDEGEADRTVDWGASDGGDSD